MRFFFINVDKKLKHLADKKVLVCSKGPPLRPLTTLWLFSAILFSIFVSTFIKRAFATNSRFFHKNMQVIKNKEIFDRKVFKLQRSAKFFPMLVETPYFGRVINPKTYLNQGIGSTFCFLSSLPYKLVNLFLFYHWKWVTTEIV